MPKELSILLAPNEILKSVCEPVSEVTPELREFIEDMKHTMIANSGAGLAAPQVGVLKRIVVFNTNIANKLPAVMINPVITKSSPQKMKSVEGCLSIPGEKFEVERSSAISVLFRDISGKEVRLLSQGVSAVVIQHEIDHLDGILLSD